MIVVPQGIAVDDERGSRGVTVGIWFTTGLPVPESRRASAVATGAWHRFSVEDQT